MAASGMPNGTQHTRSETTTLKRSKQNGVERNLTVGTEQWHGHRKTGQKFLIITNPQLSKGQ